MPDMNQQAMMAAQLRAKAPEPMTAEAEQAPEGCICPDCPMRERCHAGGGGPSEEMKAGGGMEGMGGGMKMGGVA